MLMYVLGWIAIILGPILGVIAGNIIYYKFLEKRVFASVDKKWKRDNRH